MQSNEMIRTQKAQKFNLWLGLIGMFMMFAALSSGFIVYTASGVDKGIKTTLPNTFILSTLAIIASSITIQLAFNAAKKSNPAKQKLFLIITIVLGLIFFASQIHSWNVLAERGIFFVTNNASQSFLYIFTGMHLAHIIAGLIVIARAYVGVSKNIPAEKSYFRIELANIFWHFLDLLWIYIYVFLLLNQ